MLNRYSTLMLIVGVFSGCSKHALPSAHNLDVPLSISEITTSYTNFHKITETEVFVNPELAMLCRGASQEEVEAARTQHGPHANTGILIYMNKLAADAFGKDNTPFPEGAAIVKRKTIHGYTDKDGKQVHSGDNGVGGMVKRASGYDPVHGDWEYFYFENAAKIESGHISSCVQCHDSARARDYVFGTWRKARGQAERVMLR